MNHTRITRITRGRLAPLASRRARAARGLEAGVIPVVLTPWHHDPDRRRAYCSCSTKNPCQSRIARSAASSSPSIESVRPSPRNSPVANAREASRPAKWWYAAPRAVVLYAGGDVEDIAKDREIDGAACSPSY